MSYCISCWGGISKYKLQSLFNLQKRCVRILFGKVSNRDHPEFYETCARVRPYNYQLSVQNFQLEHTKPIFNEKKSVITSSFVHLSYILWCIQNMKIQDSYIIIFEIFKNRPSDSNMMLIISKVKLNVEKNNFIFQASCIGLMPGSTFGSDNTTPITVIKRKLKDGILDTQALNSLNSEDWYPENFYQPHYPA